MILQDKVPISLYISVDIMQPQFLNDWYDCLNLASNRIVNPIERNEPYPWMAFLLIQEWKEPTNQDNAKLMTCTGAVLSRRYNEWYLSGYEKDSYRNR